MNRDVFPGGARRFPSVLRPAFGALVALTLLAAGALGAPLSRDLGDGLWYFRVHSVPADLPSNRDLDQHTAIIDVRYATADQAGATVLAGWLKFHAAPRRPLLVLVNRATAPAIVAVLKSRDALPGVLSIGPAAQPFEPDITVTVTDENERRAYDALENGTTLAALTTDNPNKQRNDEASLAHEHPPEAAVVDGDVPSDPPAPTKNRPLIDTTLQRAVQLYRGLRALKAA